jgi:hypothetical protein
MWIGPAGADAIAPIARAIAHGAHRAHEAGVA